MENEDSIIVACTFNTLIEANIVKTKLDAYGIPCYLTGENLTALTTHLLSGGIHLHIFERDRDRVAEILSTVSSGTTEDDDLPVCPNCQSRHILNVAGTPLNPGVVVRFFLQLSKKHFCLDCETEFDL